jgi:hypothetical protein
MTAVTTDGRPTSQGKCSSKSNPTPNLICDELRSLCRRNAKVINIEPEQMGPSIDLVRADLLDFGEIAGLSESSPS